MGDGTHNRGRFVVPANGSSYTTKSLMAPGIRPAAAVVESPMDYAATSESPVNRARSVNWVGENESPLLAGNQGFISVSCRISPISLEKLTITEYFFAKKNQNGFGGWIR